MSCAEDFDEIERRSADWDGEGADKPSVAAIAKARRFLQAISALGEPSIGPCSDGSIDLFWHRLGDRIVLMNFTDSSVAFYAEIDGMKFKGSADNGEGSRG